VPQTDVAAVAESPGSFTKESVRLSGTLENIGTNYFTDQKLMLTDQTGRTIPVQVPLPAEIPPTQKGQQPPNKSTTLSFYLGKQVTVTGSVETNAAGGTDEKTYVFRATHIEPKQ
jgi:hypothetical protein